MRASEKYAQLEARGEQRPRCDCHDEPKRWHARPSGGQWECNEKHKLKFRLRYHDSSTGYRDGYLTQKARKYETEPDYKDRQTVRDSRRVWFFGTSATVPSEEGREFALGLIEEQRARR